MRRVFKIKGSSGTLDYPHLTTEFKGINIVATIIIDLSVKDIISITTQLFIGNYNEVFDIV